MKDSVILGSGNSRYLKSVANFKTLYPTYDDFVAALVAGTLPVDFNGINAAGFQQLGDALSKETLLKDTTAALFGLDVTAVPDDVLVLLKTLVNNAQTSADGKAMIEFGSYVGTVETSSESTKTLTFNHPPKVLIIEGPSKYSGISIVLVRNTTIAEVEAQGDVFLFRNITWNGNSVSWLAVNPYSGANEAGQTYYYAAFF